MLRTITKTLSAPLLAVAVTGAALVIDTAPADAAVTSVRVNGKLTVRAAAANWSKATRSLKNRTKVTVTCKVTGQYIRGSVRRTAQWDRLMLGDHIPHAYVTGNPRLPVCPKPAPAPATPAPAPPPVVSVVTTPVTPPIEPNGTMNNAQFIAASVPGAQQSQREHGVPASVTIAQAILESGWGRSALSTFDRNYFGMKCFSQGVYANGCRSHATNECTAAGACFSTSASFRTYATVTNSFRDHGALLATNSRYAPAFAYKADPDLFVAEMHKAGYATDRLYTVKLTGIMAKYGLYRYDLR